MFRGSSLLSAGCGCREAGVLLASWRGGKRVGASRGRSDAFASDTASSTSSLRSFGFPRSTTRRPHTLTAPPRLTASQARCTVIRFLSAVSAGLALWPVNCVPQRHRLFKALTFAFPASAARLYCESVSRAGSVMPGRRARIQSAQRTEPPAHGASPCDRPGLTLPARGTDV